MTKTEIKEELLKAVDYKMAFCTKKLDALDKKTLKTEAMALSTQKNLYELARTVINYSGEDESTFPEQFSRRLEMFLDGKNDLKTVIDDLDSPDKEAFEVYLHTCLFLNNNLLIRYEKEKEKAPTAQRAFEADLKISYVTDLLKTFKAVYESLGGRKDVDFK